MTSAIRAQIQLVREGGDSSELPLLETIGLYVDHAETFRAIADTHVAFFSTQMLNDVLAPFTDVTNNLANRLELGAINPYTHAAAASAEASLIPMAPWPRPYGKGGQVTQMETLFEGLLERQRQSIAALQEEHAVLRREIDDYKVVIADSRDAVLASVAALQQTATDTVAVVTVEKMRIDEVVARGLETVAAVESENTSRYEKWRLDREESFTQDFAPFKESIERDLNDADAKLASLQATNVQFKNLAALGAGDIIGTHFKAESRWGRLAGFWIYGVGIVFILGAAVPLIWLFFENPNLPSGAPDWGQIIVRVSLGVLAGSGATVLVRLGGRFIAEANASKRMELEMRAFGPFTDNVADTTMVDLARVELLDRAFGKSYVVTEREDKGEVVQVSALTQILSSLAKILK